MTPISKVLSLLLAVLLVTSLFIPAAVANNAWEELAEKIQSEYWEGCDEHGNWYQYQEDSGDWLIRMHDKTVRIKPQTEEEVRKLLEFMKPCDEHSRKIGTTILIYGIALGVAIALGEILPLIPADVCGDETVVIVTDDGSEQDEIAALIEGLKPQNRMENEEYAYYIGV